MNSKRLYGGESERCEVSGHKGSTGAHRLKVEQETTGPTSPCVRRHRTVRMAHRRVALSPLPDSTLTVGLSSKRLHRLTETPGPLAGGAGRESPHPDSFRYGCSHTRTLEIARVS